MKQPYPETFVINMIWTDEKHFCFNQNSHKQNGGTWSSDNSHEIVESYNCNNEKFMLFVTIVDGKAPIVHPLVHENGRNVTANGACYLNLLNEVEWSTLRSSAIRKGY